MSAFKLSASPEAERLVMGLRAIAVVGLAVVPLNYAVLKRLLAIVETARAGDPFVAANAQRLQAVAWALLVLQLLSLVIGAIARTVSTPAHPVDVDAGFSINGWLAVLLTFGTCRRQDRQLQRNLFLGVDADRARRDRDLLRHPLGARTVEPAMGSVPVPGS